MNSFLENTDQIFYNKLSATSRDFDDIKDISLVKKDYSSWLNTYGIDFKNEFEAVINQVGLDEFLIKLLKDDNHTNKVLELNDVLFIAVNVLIDNANELNTETIYFIVKKDFIWTIQEKKGNYFEWIKTRIHENRGLVRKKNVFYLLYLLLESIIDNYSENYTKFQNEIENELDVSNIKPTPEFTSHIQNQKKILFEYKKACVSLRNTIVKLEKIHMATNKTNYLSELKEQINNLITDIDFEINAVDSSINLIFSVQGHHLNEVMKTLTIFSVIFIPITFIAGLYGMNFKFMPELETEYGYFVVLIIMVLITSISLYIFKKKKWF